MKRLYLALTSIALLALSASATWYLLQTRAATRKPDRIDVGPARPEKVVSPEQILVKPSADPAPDSDPSPADPPPEETGTDVTSQTQALVEAMASRPMAIEPDWQPGTTRVENPEPVTPRGNYVTPRWSPVGLDIAFASSDGNALWITGPAPGSRPRLLADDPKVGIGFQWNRDGMSIHAQSVDGHPVEILITGEKSPAPDHVSKVYEFDGRIWYRAEEDQPPQPVSTVEDTFTDPLLSPDETKIVYRGVETGLYMATTDGSRAIRIGRGNHPAWLPDSSGIVFDRPISDDQGPVDGDLWYASADGRELTNLTHTAGILEMYPHIAPDGTRIAYIREGAVVVARFLRSEAPAP